MDTHRGPLPGALAKPAAPAAQQQSRPSRCAPFFILSDVVIGALLCIFQYSAYIQVREGTKSARKNERTSLNHRDGSGAGEGQ